ncbi:MAG: heavy metal-binding domain-containing protein [Deltaproteobacteria bacterium]|nr:heavy metal-binding domain-containing protein [Deltaproteobacteria bacterium]
MSDPDLEAMTDLPVHARERLADMRAKKLFTSDLSVNEFVLVREAGFEPVGMVMGTSIYQVAARTPSGSKGQELVETTRALYHARELAMNRMEEEAQALGADGIIGVRLTVNLALDPSRQHWQRYRIWQQWARRIGFRRPQTITPRTGYFAQWPQLADTQWRQWCTAQGWATIPLAPWAQPVGKASYSFGPNTAEFIAIGTAIRHREGEHYRNKAGKPFQSDLSGQEFWMLIRAGYRPVGFVMGNCVYYVPPALLRAPDNASVELSEYTHALYDARELAIERLQDEAEALDATGIVGVTVAEEQHSWRTNPWNMGNAALQSGEVIELFVIGTAVVPMAAEGAPLGRPILVRTANDPIVVAREGGE